MQNRTNSELCVLVHPKQTWTFPHKDVGIKAPKCTKYAIRMYNIFIFLVSVQYFKFFLHLYELTSKIEVIKYRNQNMAVLLKVSLNSTNGRKYGIKDLGYVYNILTLPVYVLASEGTVLKSCYGISLKCSRYRDNGPTDPSLIYISLLSYI